MSPKTSTGCDGHKDARKTLVSLTMIDRASLSTRSQNFAFTARGEDAANKRPSMPASRHLAWVMPRCIGVQDLQRLHDGGIG